MTLPSINNDDLYCVRDNAVTIGCERTVASFAGAVILHNLNKTLLFKNRNMYSTAHKDALFHDVDAFGVRGIDMVTGNTSGLSIGVNRYGLAVANSHVMGTEDPTYDILTEQILMFAKDAEDGLRMTVDQLKSGRKFQWGNLILSDLDSMLAIEIAGNDHSIEWSERKVLRTGHHIMLDTEEIIKQHLGSKGVDSYVNSTIRVDRGYELFRNMTSVQDVFSALKDHGEGPSQSSICKHSSGEGQMSTVTSYVVEINHPSENGRPKVVFHVAKGNPCTSTYAAIPLVFPADEDVMNRALEMYFR